MSKSRDDDRWSRFLKEELTRVQSDSKNRTPSSIRDPENHLQRNADQNKNEDRQVIIIDSKGGSDGNQSCCPGQGPRRIIIMIVIYAIAVTAIGSFLAHLSFGIPG